MHGFVYGKDNTTLKIVHVSSFMVKDPLLCLKKVREPTVVLTTKYKGLSVVME